MSNRFFSIAPERLHQRMQTGQPVTLLDVRTAAEYGSGHVPGALSVPLDELNSADIADLTAIPDIGTGQPLYVTCQSGLRAQEAAEKLHRAGLDNLVLLQGGTEAWEKSALPMRRCGTSVSLERQVQITVGSLLVLKVFFGFTVHELFFVAGAFIGAGLMPACEE